MRRVVLVQGAQQSEFFPWKKFISDPEAIAMVLEAQRLIEGTHVDGQPLLLHTYCESCLTKDRNNLSPRYRVVAEHILLFVWSHLLWTRFPPQEKEGAVFLGQSYGLWIAAFLGGLRDFPTAVRLVTQRLLICSAVPGDSILVRKTDGIIDFESLESLCKKYGDVWLSAINHQCQCVISGASESIEAILQTIREMNGYRKTQEINIGPSWHTPKLAYAAEQVEQSFPSFDELSDLRIPVLCLDSNGKLIQVRKKEEVVGHMLAELTEPRNFLGMALQLPGNVELVELCVHEKPFLTSTVNIIREKQH